MKAKKVVELYSALNDIAMLKIPVKTAFKLMGIQSKVETAFKHYQSLEHSLCEECIDREASEGLEPGQIVVLEDKREYFVTTQMEMMEIDMDIGRLPTITKDELEGLSISLATLKGLEPILDSNEIAME